MRITCPSCQATYVVNESDIPEEGIEVECSACMTRWMQMPAGFEPQAKSPEAEAEKLAESARGIDSPVSEAPSIPEPEPEPEPEPVDLAEKAAASEAVDPGADVFVEPMPKAASLAMDEQTLDNGAKDPESVSFMDAPSDLGELPESEADEEEPAWRVPIPPAKALSEFDPLDDILAEMASGFPEAAPSAASDPTNEDAEAKPEARVDSAPSKPLEQDPAVSDSYFDEIAESAPLVYDGPAEEPWPKGDGSGPSDAFEVSGEEPAEPQSIEEIEAMAAQVERVMENQSINDISEPEPEPEPEPELEVSELEPEELAPAPAPRHWSEQIGASPAEADAPTDEIPAEDAKKDMEDLIKNLSDTMPFAGNIVEFPQADDDPTNEVDGEDDGELRPWEGAVAPIVEAAFPVVADEPTAPDEPAIAAQEDDGFEWEELEEPEEEEAIEFDPEPEPDSLEAGHIAAVEKQNGLDLRPVAPEVTNITDAEVHETPFATMGSSAPEKKPSQPSAPVEAVPSAPATSAAKPTPVDSAEDVEAAIRAQLSSFQKTKSESESKNADGKSGLLGKFGKSKNAARPAEPAKPKPVDPLKSALLDVDDGPRPRSGRRLGFFLVIYLFLALLAVYLFADNISAMVPELEPTLSVFSTMIDGLRTLTQKIISGG